jgi:hypothetical protein
MPKSQNPKKVAAATVASLDSFKNTLSGKYAAAVVEKPLGNKSFLAKQTASTSITVYLTMRKFQGGQSSKFYVRPGTVVFLEGDNIVGMATSSDQIAELRSAGRLAVEPRFSVEGFVMEELSAEEADAQANWDDPKAKARSLAERAAAAHTEAQADRLARRIQRKRAGVVESAEAPLVRLDGGADAEPEAEEAEAPVALVDADAAAEAAHAAARNKAQTSARKRRQALVERIRLGMAARLIQRVYRRRLEAVAGVWAAALRAEVAEDMDAFAQRAVPANWEDEVDIDAI